MDYFPAVKFPVVLVLLLAGGGLASSQTNEPAFDVGELDVGAVMDAATQFAQDDNGGLPPVTAVAAVSA